MTTLFHTSATHILRFDTIRDRLAPDIQLNHVVRTDWLDRARGGIDKRLRTEIMDAVGTARGPVLCSCSTIGGIAAEAGAIRIDQPMMQAAADIGGRDDPHVEPGDPLDVRVRAVDPKARAEGDVPQRELEPRGPREPGRVVIVRARVGDVRRDGAPERDAPPADPHQIRRGGARRVWRRN